MIARRVARSVQPGNAQQHQIVDPRAQDDRTRGKERRPTDQIQLHIPGPHIHRKAEIQRPQMPRHRHRQPVSCRQPISACRFRTGRRNTNLKHHPRQPLAHPIEPVRIAVLIGDPGQEMARAARGKILGQQHRVECAGALREPPDFGPQPNLGKSPVHRVDPVLFAQEQVFVQLRNRPLDRDRGRGSDQRDILAKGRPVIALIQYAVARIGTAGPGMGKDVGIDHEAGMQHRSLLQQSIRHQHLLGPGRDRSGGQPGIQIDPVARRFGCRIQPRPVDQFQ